MLMSRVPGADGSRFSRPILGDVGGGDPLTWQPKSRTRPFSMSDPQGREEDFRRLLVLDPADHPVPQRDQIPPDEQPGPPRARPDRPRRGRPRTPRTRPRAARSFRRSAGRSGRRRSGHSRYVLEIADSPGERGAAPLGDDVLDETRHDRRIATAAVEAACAPLDVLLDGRGVHDHGPGHRAGRLVGRRLARADQDAADLPARCWMSRPS